ncbi:MAG: glycosyltransferase family 39 protein [Candidatus Nitrospinota bacterium M3_3B_026]
MSARAAFFSLVVFLTLFRVVYTGWFELSLDEAYYWLWSLHPSLSYYDHPPMVAYMIAATNFLEDSERLVRLSAVMALSAITWIVYTVCSEVFDDERTGLAAAALMNIIPLFSVGGLFITPDIPLCLFWALSLYFGYRIVETQRPGWWYALGASFGLAMLSKYNAALFAPAFLLFLVFSPENRHWLFRREPYLAFALSLLVFSPVIFWNHGHDWVSFRFQLAHGFEEGGGGLAGFAEFWAGQAGLAGGLLFFFIIAAAFAAGRMGIRERRDDYLYLSFMSAPILLFFLVNSMRTHMEGNWPAPAYIAAIIAVPGAAAYYRERPHGGALKALSLSYTAAIALCAGLVVYAHVQIVEPVLPMPQKHEVSRRIYGWKLLGQESAARLKDLGEGAFIISNRYQIMSLLRYYTPDRPDAYITDGEGRFSYLGAVDHLPGKGALYVTEKGRAIVERLGEYFDRVEPAGSIKIERGGLLIREFEFYKCYNYQGGLIKI